MDKRAILEAVVLKSLLVIFLNIKCLDALLVLKLKTSSGGAILHLAQHLHIQNRILDEAAIPAHTQTFENLSLADVALVLNFNKLNI